eukprot:1144908-Pelagomonas_calceolata.AAC.13
MPVHYRFKSMSPCNTTFGAAHPLDLAVKSAPEFECTAPEVDTGAAADEAGGHAMCPLICAKSRQMLVQQLQKSEDEGGVEGCKCHAELAGPMRQEQTET